MRANSISFSRLSVRHDYEAYDVPHEEPMVYLSVRFLQRITDYAIFSSTRITGGDGVRAGRIFALNHHVTFDFLEFFLCFWLDLMH